MEDQAKVRQVKKPAKVMFALTLMFPFALMFRASKARASSPLITPERKPVTPSPVAPRVDIGPVRLSTHSAPMKLTKNFDLSEFLVGHPELATYRLDDLQLDNVKRVATLAQEVRDRRGPTNINSGGRPPDFVTKDGKTLDQLLQSRGYAPSKKSDHHDFLAADLSFKGGLSAYLAERDRLANDPRVRQVIVEAFQKPQGKSYHLHVAAVGPGHPPITGANRSFAMLNNRAVSDSALA